VALQRTGIRRLRQMVAILLCWLAVAPMPMSAKVVADANRAACAAYAESDPAFVLTDDGKLAMLGHPAWRVPDQPTWREDPYGDRNWLVRYQSLRWVESLVGHWCSGGPDSNLDRASFLLRSWYVSNTADDSARWAWYDHSVAWRTMVFIRARELLPTEDWLTQAIADGGAWLAAHRPAAGNHGLNASRGLLAAGCALARQSWIDLAADRIEGQLRQSVDEQGVSDEQAIGYQLYNYGIYSQARDELHACGQREPVGFRRIGRMPELLAYATLPNGEYEMLGDTFAKESHAIPGTSTEFTASAGQTGTPPIGTDAVYGAGFAFIHSGWGERVPYRDELVMSLRFGVGRQFHGHDDGGAITLYGLGSRLLLDSGKNSFHGAEPWSRYFLGRSAHNVVTVDGLAYSSGAYTTMRDELADGSAFFVLDNAGYADVTNRRTVLYSRGGRYLVVEDRLTSTTTRTYRQLWHLAEDADPAVAGERVVTNGPNGNVAIIQLLAGADSRIVNGRKYPTQGWLSYEYQRVVAAPVVEGVSRGQSAHYLTLLVPFAGEAAIDATVAAVYADGYALEVTIGGRTEKVSVHGAAVTIDAPADDGLPPPGPDIELDLGGRMPSPRGQG
jgi:hypothetical protein